jgi:hypothetical protein
MENIVIEKQKLILTGFEENPYAYFHYLKTCKSGNGLQLLSEINTNELHIIKSQEYYDILTFKTFICELVFNGINLFPEISCYSIICQNEIGISSLNLGLFEETMDDGHPCMAKFINLVLDSTYKMSLKEIKYIYCNNRYHQFQSEFINTIISLMFMGGSMPKVTIKTRVNKAYYKNILKIK